MSPPSVTCCCLRVDGGAGRVAGLRLGDIVESVSGVIGLAVRLQAATICCVWAKLLGKGKGDSKSGTPAVAPLTEKLTSEALRYGTRCQGILQFYLHTHALIG